VIEFAICSERYGDTSCMINMLCCPMARVLSETSFKRHAMDEEIDSVNLLLMWRLQMCTGTTLLLFPVTFWVVFHPMGWVRVKDNSFKHSNPHLPLDHYHLHHH
jgi:hypothetical protein